MTIRQKAALAALLDNIERVARELDAAPAEAGERAAEFARTHEMADNAAYQVGTLRAVVGHKATELRALLSLARQTFPAAANLNRKAA